MEIDKSAQGTLEEQMFYNRRTLKDITKMRHDNPANQVIHQDFFSYKILQDLQVNLTYLCDLMYII